jgi:glycyl-tRNA synthetase
MYTFQEIVAKLNAFWTKEGCLVLQPYDIEKGAGTFNPITFLRSLGPEPFRAAYIEPCRRPTDGRWGKNPNRLQHYFQYQVLLKPSPYNIQDLYLESLEAIGFELRNHDVRFVHDDWESPTLGAWGLGWEVQIDGQECSQFTYFQSVAGMPLKPITGEITYGIERLAAYLQNVPSILDIHWNDCLTYRDLYLKSEIEWCTYNFEESNPKLLLSHFEDFRAEAGRLVGRNLPIPAYDFVIKASHAFNLLDARGVISVTERASFIAAIRDIAKTVAECYLKSREKEGHPLVEKIKIEEVTEPATRLAPKQYSAPADFLLEIGVEELPASFVSPALSHLEHLIKKLLSDHGIGYRTLRTFGTPRRLGLLIEALSAGKKEEIVEKRGPSCETAFEANGAPKAAVSGFFRSIGMNPCSLEEITKGLYPHLAIRKVKEVDYIFYTSKKPALQTVELLEKELPHLILSIEFPKTMRWASLDYSFARPIRWLAALFGSDIVHFSIGPVYSSNITYGHRTLSSGPIMIAMAGSYKETLRTNYVLVDIDERRREIERGIEAFERENSLHVIAKERLIPQVLELTEWPSVTAAEFDRSFLAAPEEVLISEMVEHQKYFPITDRAGKLRNQFLIVANTIPTDSIRLGNVRVLSARLADGVFLFEQDLKTPLATFSEKLKGITFQKGLGSISDKTVRLAFHVKTIAPYIPHLNLDEALAACALSKADLASAMVREFPELQGKMGRIYAERQNLGRAVAQAIDEGWMPRGEAGSLPQSRSGIALAIADKIDNLLSFFALGRKPTSSSDPYALRRAALGIVRIVLSAKLPLPLRHCLEEGLGTLPKELQKKEIIDEILDFIMIRLRTALAEVGYAKGLIDACAAAAIDDCYDALLRIEALEKFRKQSAFASLIEVYRRVSGQIHNLAPQPFSPALLIEEAEKDLWHTIEAKKEIFTTALRSRNYEGALELISEFAPPLATLFDQVKILADDPKIQTNRLALLQQVGALFSNFADFQKVLE